MNAVLISCLFFSSISSLYSNEEVINIGAIFEEGFEYLEWPYRLAVDKINANSSILPNSKLNALTYNVVKEDAFSCVTKICNWSETFGLAAIFGPQTKRTTASVRALADSMKIPLILQRWEYRSHLEELSIRQRRMAIYVHPHADIKGNALKDFIVQRGWSNFALLYEDPKALIRLNPILLTRLNLTLDEEKKEKSKTIIVRQVDQVSSYIKVFKDMKLLNIRNFVIDTRTEQILDILNQAEKMEMIGVYNNYLFTSLDVHTVNLKKFEHYSCNITMFRVINPKNSQYEEITEKLEDGRVGGQVKPKMYTTQFALMYDSVLHFAKSLESLPRYKNIRTRPTNCFSGTEWNLGPDIVTAMKKTQTDGLTGNLTIDDEGFRTKFTLEEWRLTTHGLILEGYWNETGFTSLYNKTEVLEKAEITLKGHHFKVAVMDNNKPYFVSRKPDEKSSDPYKGEGHAVSLMKALAKLGNFTFEIHVKKDRGERLATGEWTGMIGDLIKNKVDFAVADITVTPERAEIMDFTHPYMDLGISIIFKKAGKKDKNLFSFLLPFSTEVWFYMLTGTLGVTIAMYVMGRFTPSEWLNPHPCNPEPEEIENQFTLSETAWLVVGCVLQQGGDIEPRATSTRMAIGYWWFFTLIMVQSYTANLAAFLTSSRLVVPIKSAEDLVRQQKIQYGCYESGSTYNFFKNSNNSLFSRIWSNMESADPKVFVRSNEKGIERVMMGNFAYFMESTSIEYEVANNCELTQVGGELDSKSYSIAAPLGSPFTAPLSKLLLVLKENGNVKKIKKQWWKGAKKCPKEEPPSNTLGLDSMGGVFLILTIGLPIACCMVILEFYWETIKTPRDQRQPVCVELCKELKSTVMGNNTSKTVPNEDDEENFISNPRQNSSTEASSKISSKKSGLS